MKFSRNINILFGTDSFNALEFFNEIDRKRDGFNYLA